MNHCFKKKSLGAIKCILGNKTMKPQLNTPNPSKRSANGKPSSIKNSQGTLSFPLLCRRHL